MRKWLLPVIAPLAGAALLVAAVAGLGRLARERLAGLDRYALPFAAVECAPPPGLARDEFLAEVQYLAGLPDRVRLLDRETPLALAAAFGRHPWVERVERVEVGRGHLRVRLAYREPVLAVAYSAGSERAVRAVDGAGVLLPVAAGWAELPLLAGTAPAPAGAAGAAWGDPRVEAAARTAAFLRPHQDRLALREIEVDGGDVWLGLARGRVRWGRPPGDEAPNEPTAEERLRRLLRE